MSKIFTNMRLAAGRGLHENVLYDRAFEQGVLMKDFTRAADLFDEAAKKASAHNNATLAARATANALLYRYLNTRSASRIAPLLKALGTLPEIECIGLQTEFMSTGPLCAELDCRQIEATITLVQDDVLRLRDLHKLASAKFQMILQQPLFTYEYVKSGVSHDEKASDLYSYHIGMYQFYEAMTKKDRDPSAAVDDLALALQAFRRCNDATWIQYITVLLDNWRISRTCWLCHREVQGYELHFSMYRARVTPYAQQLLEKLNQDSSTANLQANTLAVCTPCGSMITLKASEEAEKVRKEMTSKLDVAFSRIQKLEERVNKIQFRS